MERARLYMESYKKTEGEVPIIRRAKALQHVLENHKIIFDENDLLVGNRTDSPRAGVVSPRCLLIGLWMSLMRFPYASKIGLTYPRKTKRTTEKSSIHFGVSSR